MQAALMPTLPLRPCHTVGCQELVHPGQPCPVHGSRATCGDRERGTSCERGYDRDWQALRLAYLVAHPFCQSRTRCADAPLTRQVATQVHHRVAIADQPERRLDWENLMAVCSPCHSELGREEA